MGSGNPLKKNVLKSATRAVRKATGQTTRETSKGVSKVTGLSEDNWLNQTITFAATSPAGGATGAYDTKKVAEGKAEDQKKAYEAQAKERADTASRKEKAEAFAEMASNKGAPVKGKKYLGSQGVLGEEENSKRKRLGG